MYDIQNFYERAKALLAAQFQDEGLNGQRSNFQKFLSAMVTPCYDINDVEIQLYYDRALNSAEGVQLDGLGQILGIARTEGQSDAQYRERLYFQVFLNNSTGTPEESIRTLQFLTKAPYVDYFEKPFAAYTLFTDGEIQNFVLPVLEIPLLMTEISPAGVANVPILASFGITPVFGFATDPIVENFYVAPNALNLAQLNPFHVSDDGIDDLQFQVNRGNFNDNPFVAGFGEDGYPNLYAGHLVEVLQINGNIAPAA